MTDAKKIKERPILFSGEMVRAIIEGRKTQTRRMVKPQPSPEWTNNEKGKWLVWNGQNGWTIDSLVLKCPYGMPGDKTWQTGLIPADGWYYVDFTDKPEKPVYLRRFQDEDGWHITWGWDENDDPEAIEADDGPTTETILWKRPGDRLWVRETWRPFDPKGIYLGYIYRASEPEDADEYKWKPSIHMPRAASRILLEVTDVRVERVMNITRSDIRAEGLVCPKHLRSDDLEYNYRHWYPDEWKRLWESINGPGSWEQNSWVWVVEFKRIEP